MEAGEAAVDARAEPAGGGYPGTSVAAALLSSLFFPLVALIASLFLLGSERDPRRRGDLVTWASVSGILIVIQVVVAVFIFVGTSSGSSQAPVQAPAQLSAKQACPDGLPDDGAAGMGLKPGDYLTLCNWSGKETIAPSP